MNKETKLKMIPIIISIIALSISGWSATETYFIQQNVMDIQQSSFNMQQDVYEANLPFQKPIINVEISNFETEISHGIQTDIGLINEDICTTWKFNITLTFSNYGYGIATNTSYIVVISDFNEIRWVDLIGAYITVNDIYPDSTSNIQIINSYSNCQLSGAILIEVDDIGDKIVFIVKTEYYDKVTSSKENQTYWFKYLISEDKIYDFTVAEKDIFIEKYKEKYNENLLDVLSLHV